jgi:hypothetical protein
VTTAEVGRKFGIGIIAKATKIDDPLHSGSLGSISEVLGGSPIIMLKVYRA